MQHKKPIDMDVLDVHEKPNWLQRWIRTIREAVNHITHMGLCESFVQKLRPFHHFMMLKRHFVRAGACV